MKRIGGRLTAALSALVIASGAAALASCGDGGDGGDDGGNGYSYEITTDSAITGGSISCIPDGKTISVIVTADPGYTLSAITVTKAGGESFAVTEKDSSGNYSFTAPEGKFTVSAKFTANPDAAVATSAAAAGDIVLSDGTRISASNAAKMSPAQVAKAAAVVFYAGGASDFLGAKTLAVGTKFERNGKSWAANGAAGREADITVIQSSPSEYGSAGTAAAATFPSGDDTDGSDNWTALCAAVSDGSEAAKYPAWTWVNQYASTNSLTGGFSSGWYMPSVAELCALYRAKSAVDASLKAVGEKELKSAFWSSSQSTKESHAYYAWCVNLSDGKIGDATKYSASSTGCSVCAVRSLN